MLTCVDYTTSKFCYFTNPITWSFWATIELHDYLMYFLLNVLVVVVVFTVFSVKIQQICMKKPLFIYLKDKFFFKSWSFYIKDDVSKYVKFKLYSFNHGPILEFIWTLTPAIMLICMGWPSFRVLYSLEQLIDPLHTITVIGNQWYWTYNYSDYDVSSDIMQQLDSNNFINNYLESKGVNNCIVVKKKLIQDASLYLRKYEESKIMYDCVILSDESLPIGYPRLLSTDQVLVLPSYVSMRLLVTSVDVIHSWALPSHGLKMDAIPGRVNQINFLTQTTGTYWGQCSELCGINHGFMPIEVRVLNIDDYLYYLSLNISYRQDKLLLVVEKFFDAFVKRSIFKFKKSIILSTIDEFVFN